MIKGRSVSHAEWEFRSKARKTSTAVDEQRESDQSTADFFLGHEVSFRSGLTR